MHSQHRRAAPPFAPPPLRDEGIVEFAAEDWGAYPRLREAVAQAWDAEDQAPAPDAARIPYDSSRKLLRLLHRLQTDLPREDADRIRVTVLGPDGTNASPAMTRVPLSGLFETVGGRGVTEYILHRYFTTYLQPIVGAGGRAVGYECLLRPLPEQMPFRPAELFEKARRIGQHTFLDREARQAAIRISSAHLPQGVKRFVNFLPSSLYCADTCLQGTFDAIEETGTDPEDVVFEVVETEPLDRPEMAGIFERCRRNGVRLAVDDVGTGYATIEAIERLQPDYVKLDRRWVSHCDQDARKQRHIQDVLERAARFHGVVLAEGVEREQEWRFLSRIGVPLLQGYLFGKAEPMPGGTMLSASAP